MADNRTVSEQGLAHIRRGHEAFNRGDLSAIVELATPDVEWGSTGAFPGLDDEYLAPEAIGRWAEIVRNEWEEFEVTIGEVLHEATTWSSWRSGFAAAAAQAGRRSRCPSSRPTGSPRTTGSASALRSPSPHAALEAAGVAAQ